MEASKHRSFPNLTFLNLAIAQKRIYAELFVCHFSAQCHADSGRNTLSKGACGHIYARDLIQTGMSLQIRTEMTQCLQILYREKASMCQGRIQTGCRMSLGKNKTIPVFLLRICRINIHFFKIQVGKDICCRKRSSRMTGFCAMYSSQNALADFIRHFGKFQIIHNSSHSAAKTAQKLTTYFTLYHILL